MKLLVSRYRRLLAALCAAAAVAFGLGTVRGGSGVPVPVAARDLSAGTALRPGDLTVRTLPTAPDGLVRRAAGHTLAAPVRRGEPITDVRLRSNGLLGDSDGVAVPVRLADAEVVRLLHPGDQVDVLAARDGPLPARTVASAVPVITVPRADSGAAEGALIMVRTGREEAAALARAAVDARLSIIVVGP